MHVDVVRLRRDGEKLPPEDVKGAVPARGHLHYGYWTRSTEGGLPAARIFEAKLTKVSDARAPSLLPPLQDAVVMKILGEDMLITGTESGKPQTWWCRPVRDPAA